MYVLMNMLVCWEGEYPFPTQIAAQRVDNEMSITQSFSSRVKPPASYHGNFTEKEFGQWAPELYERAPEYLFVLKNLAGWFRIDDTLLWWDERLASFFIQGYGQMLHKLPPQSKVMGNTIGAYAGKQLGNLTVYSFFSKKEADSFGPHYRVKVELKMMRQLIRRIEEPMERLVEKAVSPVTESELKSARKMNEKRAAIRVPNNIWRMSPMASSEHSQEKVIHYEGCSYLKQIPTSNLIQHDSVNIATRKGFRPCSRCFSIQAAFSKEKEKLQDYCRDKEISFEMHDDVLHVKSNEDYWRIILNEESCLPELYHRNLKFRLSKKTVIPLYHHQKAYSETLMGYFVDIHAHDLFRNEIEKQSLEIDRSRKKTKKVMKMEAKRRGIAKVMAILDELRAVK